MKGNLSARVGITLGIIGCALLPLVCVLQGNILLGMWLFLGCLTSLIVVVVICVARSRKNDDDLDPLNDAGRTVRFVKSHKTKPVFEHDAGIWEQMKGEKTDD